MKPAINKSQDPFSQPPLSQSHILDLIPETGFILALEVASDMLHPHFPAVLARESLPTEPTVALGRRITQRVPAAPADCLETRFKVRPLSICRDTAGSLQPGDVHAAMVLGEEIFAVEVIWLAGRRGLRAGFGGGDISVDVAFADVAAVEPQLEMLGGYMALPLIL